MNIAFEIVEQKERQMTVSGSVDGEVIGYVRLFFYIPWKVTELYDLWQTDAGKSRMSRAEFAEEFFTYFKGQGYKELFMNTEDVALGEELGFQLESWDNSGWYPRYFLCRKL